MLKRSLMLQLLAASVICNGRQWVVSQEGGIGAGVNERVLSVVGERV